MLTGLGQAVSADTLRRIQVIAGASPAKAGVVYPSLNPEDYPSTGGGVTTTTPEDQAAALRWLAINYPDTGSGMPVRYEDGMPVYSTTVRAIPASQLPWQTAGGTNWLLLLAALVLLLAMRQR